MESFSFVDNFVKKILIYHIKGSLSIFEKILVYENVNQSVSYLDITVSFSYIEFYSLLKEFLLNQPPFITKYFIQMT